MPMLSLPWLLQSNSSPPAWWILVHECGPLPDSTELLPSSSTQVNFHAEEDGRRERAERTRGVESFMVDCLFRSRWKKGTEGKNDKLCLSREGKQTVATLCSRQEFHPFLYSSFLVHARCIACLSRVRMGLQSGTSYSGPQGPVKCIPTTKMAPTLPQGLIKRSYSQGRPSWRDGIAVCGEI